MDLRSFPLYMDLGKYPLILYKYGFWYKSLQSHGDYYLRGSYYQQDRLGRLNNILNCIYFCRHVILTLKTLQQHQS